MAHHARRYYAQEFEPPRPWRWIVAAVLAVAVLSLVSMYVGAELRERALKREAMTLAERPRAATPQPEFASTNYLDCSAPEVQRAREHIYACYRRELSSRIGQ